MLKARATSQVAGSLPILSGILQYPAMWSLNGDHIAGTIFLYNHFDLNKTLDVQHVYNAAARVMAKVRKYDGIT